MTVAYSNTTTFNVTRDQICTRAAAKLFVVDTGNGEVLNANVLADFSLTLNLIVKETMAVPGVLAWNRDTLTLFLQKNQVTYALGNTTMSGYPSPDHWVTTWYSTTLTADAAVNATSLTVNSITNFASGQTIGIKQTDGSTFWTTINGAPSGSTITLTAGLSVGASSGAYIYAYPSTSLADRPQRILDVVRNNNSMTVPLDPINWDEYFLLPNKDQAGIPLQYHFGNKIPNAELKIWQPYDGTSGWDYLQMVCDTIIEDVNGATDSAYFPVEWANYLIWRLADEMSEEYPVSDVKIARIRARADRKLNTLLDYSSSLSDSPTQIGLRFDGASA